jgi:type IV secretory pathway VirB10-like protein
MERAEEKVKTEITDEQAGSPAKGRKRIWLYVALGAVLPAVAIAGWFAATRPSRKHPAGPTTEDLEQQKYDAQQGQQDRQKADRIRNDNFLVRKEDDGQAQLNSLLKDLNLQKDPAVDVPTPLSDRQAKTEEEAIAHVLRDPAPAPSYPVRSNAPPPTPAQPHQVSTSSDADMRPMFVYSRTFGGARYVDAPPKQAVQQSGAPFADRNGASPGPASELRKPDQAGAEGKEQKTTLVYNEYPPVTLYEGEMMDAALVNRIIADTEPAPVVCNIARDVIDSSAQYVVFPANSRIVGLSQVVNYKGAHRLIISFHRIILPNGPSIDLPSSRKALKALDETGALGVVSNVQRHWFLQFGTAIFFGALDGLAGAAQRNRDVFSTSSVILGRTSENFQRILESIMAQYSTIVPTIRVDQGKKMLIYLSDDVLISPYAKISDRSYYAKR